jgi:hypothetical protein
MSFNFNYTFYGSINLDWTYPWTDRINFRSNNAKFYNDIGTFTTTTLPIDTSNNLLPAIKPEFYNGTLNEIYFYDSDGIPIYQTYDNKDNYIQLEYNTSQFGKQYFNNSLVRYIFPNKDTFYINKFRAIDSSGFYITINNFNVNTNYNTEYFSNFDFDLTKSKGCKLPNYNFISNFDNTQVGFYNYTYQLYYGTGIQIPLNLRTKFNIKENKSLNIFTNKLSTALYNNDFTYYWQYFSNYYGNPENTGWIIVNTIVENK